MFCLVNIQATKGHKNGLPRDEFVAAKPCWINCWEPCQEVKTSLKKNSVKKFFWNRKTCCINCWRKARRSRPPWIRTGWKSIFFNGHPSVHGAEPLADTGSARAPKELCSDKCMTWPSLNCPFFQISASSPRQFWVWASPTTPREFVVRMTEILACNFWTVSQDSNKTALQFCLKRTSYTKQFEIMYRQPKGNSFGAEKWTKGPCSICVRNTHPGLLGSTRGAGGRQPKYAATTVKGRIAYTRIIFCLIWTTQKPRQRGCRQHKWMNYDRRVLPPAAPWLQIPFCADSDIFPQCITWDCKRWHHPISKRRWVDRDTCQVLTVP